MSKPAISPMPRQWSDNVGWIYQVKPNEEGIHFKGHMQNDTIPWSPLALLAWKPSYMEAENDLAAFASKMNWVEDSIL